MSLSKIILLSLVSCMLLRYISGSVYFGVCFIIISLLFVFIYRPRPLLLSLFEVFALILFLGCISISVINFFRFGDGRAVYYSVMFLVSFLLASTMHSSISKRDVLWISKASICTYLSFVGFLGFYIGFDPESMNEFFPNSSRNIVSGIALILQVFYSTLFYLVRGKLPLITALLTFALSCVAFGRSGIIFSSAILSLTLYDFLYRSMRAGAIKKFVLFLLFLISLLSVFVFSLWDASVYYMMSSTNFERGLQSPRQLMIQEYIAGLGVLEFFVGGDISTSSTIMLYGGNPHNSFIFGHYFMGLAYVVLLIYLSISSLFFAVTRNGVYVFLLITIFLGRMFFDVISFPGVFDFIVFYIFICLMAERKSGSMSAKNESDGSSSKFISCTR